VTKVVKHLFRHAVLSETATFDASDNLRVVIETPKGSQAKYAYDPECDCFVLKTVMPSGMTFPYDFGFIPSTLGEDGDPVDVLVLMDFPVVPGCILTARLIGVIEAEQKEKGDEAIRNDRLIAVATHARTHDGVRTLKDLRPHLLEEITGFFVDYNRLHDKKFKPIDNGDPQTAWKLVREGQERFKKQRRKRK
jgi:inorganic pyrophosphatase